ncbi:uncharacterized protein LOC103796133 [Callithrix jacchus]
MRDGLAEGRHDEEQRGGAGRGRACALQKGAREPSCQPASVPACSRRCGMEGKGHESGVTLGQSPRMLSARRIAVQGGGTRTREAERGGACALPQEGLRWSALPRRRRAMSLRTRCLEIF